MITDSPLKLSRQEILSIFNLFFAAFFLLPTFIGKQFRLQLGELQSEEIAALILMSLWLISSFLLLHSLKSTAFWEYFAVAGLCLIALGTGMHIVGNQLNDHVFKAYQIIGEPKTVAEYYDEYLSHQLMMIGYFVYLVGITKLHINQVQSTIRQLLAVIATSILNGIALFLFAVEGQVVLITIAGILALFIVNIQHDNFQIWKKPIQLFILISMLTTAILLACWGLYWGYFPEFSKLGII